MDNKVELYADAICGTGFNDLSFASNMCNLGLARFTGNQHNPEWSWCKDKLVLLSVSELECIYNSIKPKEKSWFNR